MIKNKKLKKGAISYRIFFAIAWIALFSNACEKDNDPPPPVIQDPPGLSGESYLVASKWAEMTLFNLRFSAFNTPTYSSRSLGYLGLTMYESIVQGDDTHKSLSGQLTGLVLPTIEAGKKYSWALSLNAAQDTLLKLLYPVPGNSHRYIHEKIDSLSDAIQEEHSKNIDPEIIERSVKFGVSVAVAIYNWSLTDGGDKGYTRNFDPGYVFPRGDSYWIPPIRGQTISQYPLHPHWGNNRTFVPANGSLAVPAIIRYSTNPDSDYYKLYKAVYDKDKVLTLAEREMAAWWGDDPTETFSPPGHSYHIANLAIKKTQPSLIKATEAFARTGMAVADAFIRCWKAKYVYHNERPQSYIVKNIDPRYIVFWPEPPFPAFPSGHSIQSSAAATVMTSLFGDNFAFIDSVHYNYRRFDDIRFFDLRYPPRSFTSFNQAAEECAQSRFLGGIHTVQDNVAGAAQGVVIGNNVNALQWLR